MHDSLFSAVLLITDSNSIERLQSTGTWPQVALRYEEMKGIEQVMFLDRDAQAITHIAMLNGSQPWLEVKVPGQPITFVPQVEEVMDMFDPIEVREDSLQAMAALGNAPIQHREALLIEDIDELLNAEDPSGYMVSEIQDQAIINRRNINTTAALNALKGELGDLEALSKEFAVDVEKPIEGVAMEQLPTNWSKGWNKSEEEERALLSLLNSAFDSHVEEVKDWQI